MIDHKVRSVVNSVSMASDETFFESILLGLATVIDADYVFIAQLDKTNTNAATHTTVAHGQVVDDFEYALKGTPCEITQSGSCCIHPSGIQPLYPEDLLLVDMGIEGYVGVPLKNKNDRVDYILVALFEEPVQGANEVESLFMLFSGMILKELEKQAVMQKLKTTDQIIRDSKEAIMVTDVNTNIIFVNKAFCEITGYSEREVFNKTPKILSSGQHEKVFYQALWNQLHETGYWQGEILNKKKNGQPFTSNLAINTLKNEQTNEVHYVGFFADITEQKAKDRELYRQTHYDVLTGLANRHYLMERLGQAASHARATASDFYILYIGIDHFKDVNDFFGFTTGDQLLQQVGKRINAMLRKSDVLARVGGDQFALLVSNVDEQYLVQSVLERIYRLFDGPIVIDGHEHRVSLSIGVAKYPDDDLMVEDLVKKAEQALYNAKDSGRNNFCFYTDEIQTKVIRRITLKNALKLAIEREQIEVFFQPIIDIKTSKVRKLEALARWTHEGQFVSPDEFIRIAEEFGLIYDLGLLVLKKSCETALEIKKLGFKDIAVNVNRSIKEFEYEDCVRDWIEMLNQCGLEGRDINFELTESILAPDQGSNLEKLAALQSNGSHISLDDFGTGFSSLSYIRNFPIDELKIDRSFIMHMERDEEDRVLVKTIIAMATALGIKTVAEGIETEQHMADLVALGCDFGQGYLIAKPLPKTELIEFLTHSYTSSV